MPRLCALRGWRGVDRARNESGRTPGHRARVIRTARGGALSRPVSSSKYGKEAKCSPAYARRRRSHLLQQRSQRKEASLHGKEASAKKPACYGKEANAKKPACYGEEATCQLRQSSQFHQAANVLFLWFLAGDGRSLRSTRSTAPRAILRRLAIRRWDSPFSW